MSQCCDSKMTVIKGHIFDLQHFSVNDGPGIRSTVFFKGCPLRCQWCSNPESQRMVPEMIFNRNLCRCCYECVAAGPRCANVIADDGSREIDRARCRGNGECARICPNDARTLAGREVSLDEVMREIIKDDLFYRNSGGGVTASGGEPAYQPEFLMALFAACREAGIHTTLDTCGQVAGPVFEDILAVTDLVYYDLKHMDSGAHLSLTGVENSLILENAARVADSGVPLVLRVPLIPGQNDGAENIRATSDFARELGADRLDLLPFHQFGSLKYHVLGLAYELAETPMDSADRVDEICRLYQASGLSVRAA